MPNRLRSLLLLSVLLLTVSAYGQSQPAWLADILENRSSLADPAERAEAARLMREIQEERKAAAVERARREGLPLRQEMPGGTVVEIMDYDGDRPLYATTYNREAAISTAALEAQVSFELDGAGFSVGVWDGGSVRATHEAFANGRAVSQDGTSVNNHATHIGGTIAAAGPNARAHGMAPAAQIDSYDWNSDKAEMTARGASFPNEPEALLLSNHSYGYRSGWDWNGSNWQWFGSGTNQTAVEQNFGRYNNYARDMDSLAYSLPYYLAFWAGGNDRSNNPSNGSTVVLGGQTVTYDSAIHPPGDGVYKKGYDAIGFESLAKNVLTVGSVNDAVTSGQRDLSRASMSTFSSWGPTDDGRIKPDIVANGGGIYSAASGSDSTYGTMSGTSMATANATGSAQLVVSKFASLFPNHALRASTLKALLIHTADDLGEPGPDYRFGWGLMNTHAAALQIASHKASPGSHRLVEAQLTSTGASHSYTFAWDGSSPIRATLTWTDPAGPSTTAHDSRVSRLANNLDLVIHGPDSEVHQPWVMPYVGDWRTEMLSEPAGTGKNDTDNVEQVFLASPTPGIYTATITVDGTLANDQQFYSLIISGSEDTTAEAPTLLAQIHSASGDMAVFDIEGTGFQQGAEVSLVLPGQTPRVAFSHEITPSRVKARIDTSELAGGTWDLVITNADGQQATIPGVYAVSAPLWVESFDGAVEGWSSSASVGSTHWALTDSASRTPSRSYHASGPDTRNLDALQSTAIEIPADAEELSLSFWHSYSFEYRRDGGILELSIDGGTWFDVTSTSSGASFQVGGYNNTLTGTGNPSSRNPLVGSPAWTGNKSDFSEVVVSLDPAKFAGAALRVRWLLGTDDSTPSTGWYIDDVALRGATATPLSVPELIDPAYADEAIVSGVSVNLHVVARNSDGTEDLTYTWTVNDSREAPVSFSDNGTATASSTTASFSAAGTYAFEVTVRNSLSQTVSSDVEVSVIQAETAVQVEPEAVSVTVSETQLFEAFALDQFGHGINPSPTFSWSVDPAAGAVSSSGFFTAADTAGGPFPLTATTPGGVAGSASVTIESPATGFAGWQEQYFSTGESEDPEIGGDTADPDQDGVPNLLEYALGGNPLEASREVLPKASIERSGGETTVVLTFSRPLAISDVSYAVEASTDLVSWQDVLPESWQVEEAGDQEKVTVRHPVSAERKAFLRLSVSH